MSTAGILKKSAGGVLLKNASGILVKDYKCAYCCGPTPAVMTGVFSDLTECSCAKFVVSGVNLYRKITTPLSISVAGPFAMNQHPTNLCSWALTQDCTGTVGIWVEEDACAGDPDAEMEISLVNAAFVIAETYVFVGVKYLGGTYNIPDVYSAPVAWYYSFYKYADYGPGGACSPIGPIDNSNDPCDTNIQFWALYTGGTGTVSG